MDHIEEQMQKAIKEGAFDDLPGKGKPLPFDSNVPHSENWMVNKILKNADYLPPWLELDKKIRESKAVAEVMVQEHLGWLAEEKARLAEVSSRDAVDIIERIHRHHERVQGEFQELIRSINPMIRRMNMEVPVSHFQKNVIDETVWLKRFEVCEDAYLGIVQESYFSAPAIGEQKQSGFFKKLLNKLRHA